MNAVCTRDLVQLAYSNDLLPVSELTPGGLPLLFFDWRGKENDQQRVQTASAIKTVEKVHDWFEHYLLGGDFKEDQRHVLGIDLAHPLHSAFHDRNLTYKDSTILRNLVRRKLIPALSFLLEKFTPYRKYTNTLRELEREYQSQRQPDLPRYAFYELRFGANLAPDSLRQDLETQLSAINGRIEETKQQLLHVPIDLNVGMRGVVSAFGDMYRCFDLPDWMEYADWFVSALNLLYSDGWLDFRSTGDKTWVDGEGVRRPYLQHICIDHSDNIINYRLESSYGALGAYLQLLVATYGSPLKPAWGNEWSAAKDELLKRLWATIVREYKKELRPGLKVNFPEGGNPLTDAVRDEEEKLCGRQIRRLERKLEKVERTVQVS